MISKDQIKDLLYSPSDWPDVAKGKPPFYKYSITSDGKSFYIFGANHARDPEDKMFPLLREFWNDFIQNDLNSKKILLVEGGIRRLRESETEAIERDSESGLLTLWADHNKVMVESIEPTLNDELSQLLTHFNKNEIAYYYFIRTVHQWLRLPKGQSGFEEYITKSLTHNAETFGWTNYDFSLTHMKELHVKYFSRDFDNDLETKDETCFLNLFISVKDRSNINRIGAELATIRNIHMVLKIQERWMAGFSIFTALGQSHVILQERAIRRILEAAACPKRQQL